MRLVYHPFISGLFSQSSPIILAWLRTFCKPQKQKAVTLSVSSLTVSDASVERHTLSPCLSLKVDSTSLSIDCRIGNPEDTMAERNNYQRSKLDSSVDTVDVEVSSGSRSKTSDEQTLAHFGKRQRFRRNFNFLSVVGLTSTLMLSWEGALAGFQAVLFNGGPTGIITTFPIVFAGVFMQTLVMAEMSSMIPLSGGQYNWVAILSPPRFSNFLSYVTGWIITIAWQAAVAALSWLASNMIVSLASFNYPDYGVQHWHATLIFYAIIVLGILVNTYLGRIFPTLESFAFLIHCIGFFVILVVMVYLAPKTPSKEVFDNYINGGGFSTTAQSVFVGSIPVAFGFNGIDAAAHIAEEIENATRVIPKAMIASIVLYFLMGYTVCILVVFCSRVEDVLTDSFSFPIITIFGNITDSKSGTSALVSLIILVLICGVCGLLATASRMLWAFAREDGVPFSSYISRIEPRTQLPIFSIGVTSALSLLLALIGLGSEAAFNALSGLTVAGFYSAFIVSASTMLWRRCTTPTANIPWGPFRLGKAGVPVTLAALAYSVVGLVFSFWPPVAQVDAKSFNWSLVVYLGVLTGAMGWWGVRARKTYKGPKMEISSQQWLELFERGDWRES
ncbi:hypothetical protein M501DRAFT_998239 [Patellaria atrata CBS 101060]|uniref:Amino acid transporter n=1 Tax=Patellaria atrata CBS 101060 TaxID=1346257 RepID=A0A9P4SGC0_9PEZI|nr:hypothetical protein M501DRAFT_998239 [Patellaria atrata CBS 101060]